MNLDWRSAEVIANLISLGADEFATKSEVYDAEISGPGNVVCFQNASFEYVGNGAWHRYSH